MRSCSEDTDLTTAFSSKIEKEITPIQKEKGEKAEGRSVVVHSIEMIMPLP